MDFRADSRTNDMSPRKTEQYTYSYESPNLKCVVLLLVVLPGTWFSSCFLRRSLSYLNGSAFRFYQHVLFSSQ